MKTFFLSNADLKETIDLLRIVLGARRVAPLPGANALTINDAPGQGGGGRAHRRDRGQAAGRGGGGGGDPGGEPQPPQGVRHRDHVRPARRARASRARSSPSDGHGDDHRRRGNPVTTSGPSPSTTTPTKPHLVITSLPGVIYRLLKTDTSTRLLANPQLRDQRGPDRAGPLRRPGAGARSRPSPPSPPAASPSSRSRRSSTRTWASTSTSRRASTTTAT